MKKTSSKRSKTKKTTKRADNSLAKEISASKKELTAKNFLNIHWEIAHALLNNKINPATANAFASQTQRILGFKKLEIEKARMMGEKLNAKLLPE